MSGAPGNGTSGGIGEIELELFSHRFAAIAWQMGEVLRRTALSVNIKERLDFSCALLDPAGELVVNAPHIPVHLGALGLCVRTVREQLEMGPGDVVVTNHPAFGGSHLPDVTLITPVYRDDADSVTLLGYVASRAHHAEIGGSRPGSMPPAARSLIEEGVVIAPRYLVRGGRAQWAEIRELLEAEPYPSRAVEENLADLAAAQAANQRGKQALLGLVAQHGEHTTLGYMRALTEQSALLIGEALGRLGGNRFEALERLDDGSPIQVSIELSDERGVIDFSNSAATHPGNLNATPAVVRSAVLYVLRLLIGRPLPLNEGLLKTIDLRIPEGMLNPYFGEDPACCPAVVGGNVETSQRIVDTLLKAFGIAACSQGTMNNVLFGNRSFGYYETVGGGSGASRRQPGASAVHSHMTNTAITDPEILEHRYPVRLERFAIRRGSGGSGKQRGGEGVEREWTFLAPMSLSILSQHRVIAPYGMAGGGAGMKGEQELVRRTGERLVLAGIDSCEVEPGDRLVLRTPGGGGWGLAAIEEER